MTVQLEQTAAGTILPVRAQPGARRNAIVGEHAGAVRVAVTAAPDKGKANDAIAELLAKTFGIPKSAVELLSGATSRQKRFMLHDLNRDVIAAILQRLI